MSVRRYVVPAALLLVSLGVVAGTAPAASADACLNTGWSSYSPRQTFIGQLYSGWYADGQVDASKYSRRFDRPSGEYKFRQYNCNVERGTFNNISYQEKICVVACTYGSWYSQRTTGPNYREGLLTNGLPVRW